MVFPDKPHAGRISSKIEDTADFLFERELVAGGDDAYRNRVPSPSLFGEPPIVYTVVALNNIKQMEIQKEKERQKQLDAQDKAKENRKTRNKSWNQNSLTSVFRDLGSPIDSTQVIPLEGGSLHDGDQIEDNRVARAVESQEGGMEDDDTQGEDINYQEEVSSEEEYSSLDGFVAVGDNDSGCESDNSVSYKMRNEDWDPNEPF